jgi:Xaa-Pro aminopeptidase
VADAAHVFSYGVWRPCSVPGASGDVRRIESILNASAVDSAEALAEALDRMRLRQRSLGLDDDGLGHSVRQRIVERLIDVKIAPASGHLAEARRVKGPYEIECLARALHIAEEALDAVIQMLERGTTEREAAMRCASEIVKRGATPRPTLVAAGSRAWIPTTWPTDQALRMGDIVRLDAGCAYRGYCASVARTAVLGEPAATDEAAYEAVRAGLDAACEAAAPGAAAAQVFDAQVRAIEAAGLRDDRAVDAGSGIGLAPRERPTLAGVDATPLQVGEVLCVEATHCELGTLGLVVRNTVLITTDGARTLNRSRHDLIVLD